MIFLVALKSLSVNEVWAHPAIAQRKKQKENTVAKDLLKKIKMVLKVTTTPPARLPNTKTVTAPAVVGTTAVLTPNRPKQWGGYCIWPSEAVLITELYFTEMWDYVVLEAKTAT
jgi:hypothetical protein